MQLMRRAMALCHAKPSWNGASLEVGVKRPTPSRNIPGLLLLSGVRGGGLLLQAKGTLTSNGGPIAKL